MSVNPPRSSAGDGNKLILQKGDGPCEGYLQVYHSGQWGYVGDKNWNSSTEEVVCRSTLCGERNSSREAMRPSHTNVWLNELRCNGSESHLWDCQHPGWNISVFQKDTSMRVRCTRKSSADSVDSRRLAGPGRCQAVLPTA